MNKFEWEIHMSCALLVRVGKPYGLHGMNNQLGSTKSS